MLTPWRRSHVETGGCSTGLRRPEQDRDGFCRSKQDARWMKNLMKLVSTCESGNWKLDKFDRFWQKLWLKEITQTYQTYTKTHTQRFFWPPLDFLPFARGRVSRLKDGEADPGDYRHAGSWNRFHNLQVHQNVGVWKWGYTVFICFYSQLNGEQVGKYGKNDVSF